MRLGFIGFGEVGYEIGRGLKGEGLAEICAYDPLAEDKKFGSMIRERAVSAGIVLIPRPQTVVENSDVIIVAVPGTKAVGVAEEVADIPLSGKIYVDVSTSSQKAKAAIAGIVEEKGALFADGALMSSISLSKHKVPTLLSGRGSEAFIQVMAPYNMNLKKVSNKPGDATAIKLVRSIYTKGIATLAAEMIEAAHLLQVDSLVIESISEMLNTKSFEDTMSFLVTASAFHAERQAHEMDDVAEMLIELGVKPTMTLATKARLDWFAGLNIRKKFPDKRPEKWQEVAVFWQSRKMDESR